jgi:hypothetical protein
MCLTRTACRDGPNPSNICAHTHNTRFVKFDYNWSPCGSSVTISVTMDTAQSDHVLHAWRAGDVQPTHSHTKHMGTYVFLWAQCVFYFSVQLPTSTTGPLCPQEHVKKTYVPMCFVWEWVGCTSPARHACYLLINPIACTPFVLLMSAPPES